MHSFIKHIFGALMPPIDAEQQPSLSQEQRQLLQSQLAPRAPGMLRSLVAGAVGMLPTGALDQICGALFAILQVRLEQNCTAQQAGAKSTGLAAQLGGWSCGHAASRGARPDLRHPVRHTAGAA